MTELDEVRYGNSMITYTVTRSRRRTKTIEITLDATEGVLVAAPERASREQIRDVVTRRASWILERAGEGCVAPRPKSFVSGETLPYAGREVRMDVVHADVPRVRLRFTHWAFSVTAPASLQGEVRRAAIRNAFVRWYRRRAAERVRASIERWTTRTLSKPGKVLIRDQRQRWGSCAPDGTLRFNWRIAMADQSLVDYVVLHELGHLAHKNHSREFWATIERAMPDYRLLRQRLKEVGPQLSL